MPIGPSFPPRLALIVGLLAALAFAGCGGALPPDSDGQYTQAAHLFAGVSVGDQIDASRGDKEDWRKFRFVEDSEVTVLVVMAPLAENQVMGKVEIFDETFSKMHGAPVRRGQNRYELRFTASAGHDYYVVVKAHDEAGPYQIRLDGAPVDPCKRCGPDQICFQQRCVAKPPPAPRDPCGGCPPDLACDPAIAECVLPACVGVTCRRGKVCDSRGRCAKVARAPRLKCPRGQTARRGKCVPAAKPPPEPAGEMLSVRANVVQVVDLGGGKSEIYLDKGKVHGLKKSLPPGRLSGSGGRVRLVKIFAVRSRATVNVDAKTVRGRGQVVTFLVPKK